ncbi:hypothetical protein B9Y60_10560 [Stenotrophomonas maltophilia]|uniref:hypothetical protein n=1 Tax=Stenotrophomonas maltophilia TaxID=40324 RepID=UPI000C267447|nr:hypothetical protein [Stenotrophomonas maltophilia]PJL52196.1 hypothetical protein B9Y73_10560 [Stenotrophomonas maltophilia]PJL55117.1 hypothetical protein B9Y60_10560 [Stenotrophomonas maltophilia]
MKVSGFNVVYVPDIYEEFNRNQLRHIDPLALAHVEESHFFYVENSAIKVYFYYWEGEVFFVNPAAEDAEEWIREELCLPEDIFWDVITALGEEAILCGFATQKVGT